MSKLSTFLNPENIQEEREVVISSRFKDDKGNPVPFKIRAMTQAENDQNVKLCTKKRRVGNQTEEYFDNIEFSRRTIVEATVEPDFRAKEMCDAYGVLDPLLVPGKMLRPGEYSRLMQEINELSGFADLEEEAKN